MRYTRAVLSLDLLTNSSLDTQDGSLHNMLNKFLKGILQNLNHTQTPYTNSLKLKKIDLIYYSCIGAFASPIANTNVPIQLYYIIADTNVADTVTVTQ